MSLFFSGLSRLGAVKVRITIIVLTISATCLKSIQICNIFGSVANHVIHSQFMAQGSILNISCKIGLLQGAGTHFATCFNAIHRLLRLKRFLKATIHGDAF